MSDLVSSGSSSIFFAVLLGALGLYLLGSFRRQKAPPGPWPLPLIGNAHQLPTKLPWLVFSEWQKIYGNIMHLDVFGQSIVVINSRKIAKDLLDKRSAMYSDRPHLVMASLCGYEQSFVMKPYGDGWRTQRRLVQSDFSPSLVPRYYSLQDAEAAILARNIMSDPSSLESEVKLRIGGIIMRVAYGYQVKSADDPMLQTPLTALENFSKTTTPGSFMVDIIPALQHLPKSFPGAGFLKTAEEWWKCTNDTACLPYEWCKKNLETGKALAPNMCGRIIEETGESMSADDETSLKWAAAAVLGGGLDTNMTSALTFFRAMILYPHVAAKAQAELDAVVGRNRLPTIADRPNLPYTRSIMAEIFRIAPAVPLGIPHALTQDDVYEGYHLPKGAIVMPNVWHMLHDPQVYPNPEEFNPDRFNGLESEMAKVNDLTFGFGRRVCPGMHFAEGTLFAIIATTLATCDILPGLDENGKEVIPTRGYVTGTIAFPESFSLRLKPRSPQAASLLAEVSSEME